MVNRYVAWLVVSASIALGGCSQEVNEFQSSWEARALALQRQLDNDAPLVRATFLATHNSYNAAAYTWANRYIDPNQVHSIYDQLRMGIRALELDVHSFPRFDVDSQTFIDDLLLCHGMGNHLGCSPFDHPFQQGLEEIANWLNLPDNQDEVLLVYIEDHIDAEDYSMAIEALETTLGNYLYRPDTSCDGIPTTLTENQILASGKQIVLITDGCRQSEFNRLVFAGTEGDLDGYPTSNKDNLLPFPTCDTGRFSRNDYNELLIRMQEDRTVLSNAVKDDLTLNTPELVQRMTECEVNIIGMDKLRPFDGRLEAAIWSWAEDQPPLESQQRLCASHEADHRFYARDCQMPQRFACRQPETGEWMITQVSGPWEQGVEQCQTEGLGEFTVPFSGYENLKLSDVKDNAGQQSVWLNQPGI